MQADQTALAAHREWLRTRRFDAWRELIRAVQDLPGMPDEAFIGQVHGQLLRVWEAAEMLKALAPGDIRDVIDRLQEPVGDALSAPDIRVSWNPGDLFGAYQLLEQMMRSVIQEPLP